MDIELITLLIIGLVLLLVFVWYVWNLTRPPANLGPRWDVKTLDSNYADKVWGRLWLDPENQELNYLIQIKGVNGTIKRAHFYLPEHDSDTLAHPEGKVANFYSRNDYQVISGNWSYTDLHQPLTDKIITYLFDQALELIITLPSNNQELKLYFVLDTSLRSNEDDRR